MSGTDDDTVREFRLPRWHVWGCIAGACFFTAMTALSFWTLLLPQPVETDVQDTPAWGIACIAFFSFFTLFSAYGAYADAGSRLQVYRDRFELCGVFRVRKMRFAEVTSATWKAIDGWLTLRSSTQKITLKLSEYEIPASDELRAMFRSAIPPHVQQNWIGAENRGLARRRLAKRSLSFVPLGVVLLFLALWCGKSLGDLKPAFVTAGWMFAWFPILAYRATAKLQSEPLSRASS